MKLGDLVFSLTEPPDLHRSVWPKLQFTQERGRGYLRYATWNGNGTGVIYPTSNQRMPWRFPIGYRGVVKQKPVVFSDTNSERNSIFQDASKTDF